MHLSVCGKSQEHSTPAFVIFGHSQGASDGEEDDGDAFSSIAAIVIVVPEVLVSVVVVVALFSVTSRHDAVIINVKTSRFRNGFGIL